jgi:hypothetical protein
VSLSALQGSSVRSSTLYTCIQYTYPQRVGGERGELNQRRLEGRYFTKLGRKYQHDCATSYLQSINSDKHLPQSPFTGQFCGWQHFALVPIQLISPWTLPFTSASARPAAASCQVGQAARPLSSPEVGVMKQLGFDLTDKTGSAQLHPCTRLKLTL